MAKRIRRGPIPKRWAADNIQIKSKTRHRSFGASVMKGATKESGAGAASYRAHMRSAGQIKFDKETEEMYISVKPIPYTELSLEKWLNMPKYIDKYGKDRTKKLPLVEVLKKIAELKTVNTPGGAVLVEHEAAKHVIVEDARGIEHMRPEPFVNKFKSPKDRRLAHLKDRANAYFNMTGRIKPIDEESLPSRQTVDTWARKKVYDNGREIIWLYMSGENHFFLRLSEGLLSKSVSYLGRRRALQALEQWRITWFEKLAI